VYTTADVTLSPGTVNPVSVTLTASNLPVGTVFTLRIIPASGAEQLFVSSPTTGTFASSTATAAVQFPYSQINLMQAYANVPLSAGLAPQIDGDIAERLLIATAIGEPSTVTVVTRSGNTLSFQPPSAFLQAVY
jgi:hypothetical protein